MEYIKNIGERNIKRGLLESDKLRRRTLTPLGTPYELVGTLAGPRCPYSAIWCVLIWKTNKKEAFGAKRRHLEAELGRNQSRAPAELFCRGNIPPGGGNQCHRHHQRSSHREGVNLHQHVYGHHLLSNPSSSFVSDIFLKTSD